MQKDSKAALRVSEAKSSSPKVTRRAVQGWGKAGEQQPTPSTWFAMGVVPIWRIATSS